MIDSLLAEPIGGWRARSWRLRCPTRSPSHRIASPLWPTGNPRIVRLPRATSSGSSNDELVKVVDKVDERVDYDLARWTTRAGWTTVGAAR